MDALSARVLLARAPGLSAEHMPALIAALGDDFHRLDDPRGLAHLPLRPAALAFLAHPNTTALQADLRWVTAHGARVLLSTDPEYPPNLLHLGYAPAALYVRGDSSALVTTQLAIVGSRSPTPAGRTIARDFAASFAGSGLTITSGLAFGIDAAAHQGCLLAGGQTVAVCGAGLDRIYPRTHEDLAERIAEHGALVSQFPPRTPPARGNFPRRNRLISALAVGTVVVEASVRSGSLGTARIAQKLGRAVFAVPGSIHSPLSQGCHELLRAGAQLADSAAGVLAHLRIPLTKQYVTSEKRAFGKARALDKKYEMLLDALGFEPATVDVLAARTALAGESIASMLLILELEGHVAPYPGGRFGRISR